VEGPGAPDGLSPAFQMLGLLTLVAVAPSLLLLATCFTRIIVVLAFLRQAIGLQHMPPNQVLIGLALFLTVAVMAPVAEQIRTEAYEPFVAKQIEAGVAGERALAPIRAFLLESTREADLELFLRISKQQPPADVAATPLTALLPAFVISELRTAFEIGFMIFLPFLVVDLVVSSLLISMGMIVLPPIVVSLPFKLMLFVLVDGWNLVLGSLALGLS
jgi:flagellar biosynthetic protein FliP